MGRTLHDALGGSHWPKMNSQVMGGRGGSEVSCVSVARSWLGPSIRRSKTGEVGCLTRPCRIRSGGRVRTKLGVQEGEDRTGAGQSSGQAENGRRCDSLAMGEGMTSQRKSRSELALRILPNAASGLDGVSLAWTESGPALALCDGGH